MNYKLKFLIFFIAFKVNSQNQKLNSFNDSITKLDEVILKGNTILGNKFASINRTGSSFYLSKAELNQFSDIDINRALDRIPGITVYEEDGFGLRPNISLRGTSPERSSKLQLWKMAYLRLLHLTAPLLLTIFHQLLECLLLRY